MARCKSCGRERVKYGGTLAKPIRKREVLAAALRSYTEKRGVGDDFILSLKLQKLPALAEHYGVDLSKPVGALALVYFLAVDHVPGFRVQDGRERGRPRRNDDLRRQQEEYYRKAASICEVKKLTEEIEARQAEGHRVTAKDVIAEHYRDAPAKERNRLISAMQKKVSKVRVANKNRKPREK